MPRGIGVDGGRMPGRPDGRGRTRKHYALRILCKERDKKGARLCSKRVVTIIKM